MATGLPNLSFTEIGSGQTMPARMRLDTYEAAYERRVANENRLAVQTDLPRNATVYSTTIQLPTLSNPDSTAFSFVVTIPKLSTTTFSNASLVANLQAQSSTSPGWATVYTANMTATASEAAGGFQYEYVNSDTTKDEFRLEIITTGGAAAISDNQAVVDVLFNGTQRRRVLSIVGTVETNTQSAFSSEIESFIQQTTLDSPVFYIAPNLAEESMIVKRFNGTFKVDRITIDRGEGRQAIITMSLTQEGTWADE